MPPLYSCQRVEGLKCTLPLYTLVKPGAYKGCSFPIHNTPEQDTLSYFMIQASQNLPQDTKPNQPLLRHCSRRNHAVWWLVIHAGPLCSIVHIARIISLQKIYRLYGWKHHIVERRGDITDAGQTIILLDQKVPEGEIQHISKIPIHDRLNMTKSWNCPRLQSQKEKDNTVPKSR